jgi:DNA-binding protein H-NS
MTEKTYRQLAAELAELDVQIEAAWKQERCAVLRDLRERMAAWEIEANELGPYKRGSYHTKPVKKLYRDPDTGREWSGRGHPPAWIEGKDRSLFLIDDDRRNTARTSNRRDATQQRLSNSTKF